MTAYWKLPWKRNIRQVPASILSKIQALPSSIDVVPVCTKRISRMDLEMGVYDHLKMTIDKNQPSFPARLLPLAEVGLYSSKNSRGWEVKRTDLPKINKTFYLGERPIYGDWSNGSFSLWQKREVYQIDEYSPTDYSIRIDMLKAVGDIFVFNFSLDCVLDPNDEDFQEDLLFCLNVLQENTGTCDIDRSDRSRDDYIATTLVDWEIFPPGSIEQFLTKARSAIGSADPKVNVVIEARVTEFRRLSPERFILGKGGFNRYIGAVLPNKVVVFENIRYGNALYVLYENWEDVSQRSRTELIKGTSADYERIPHVDGWEKQFREAVRRRPLSRRK